MCVQRREEGQRGRGRLNFLEFKVNLIYIEF